MVTPKWHEKHMAVAKKWSKSCKINGFLIFWALNDEYL
jgi:hypothetical protein